MRCCSDWLNIANAYNFRNTGEHLIEISSCLFLTPSSVAIVVCLLYLLCRFMTVLILVASHCQQNLEISHSSLAKS